VPWQGRAVKQGPVIYVVAEGSGNIGKRIKAWLIENDDPEADDMFVLMQPVQFRQPADIEALINAIDHRNLKPRLIVVDTLARCFLGGDENSAQDMGAFVEACNEVQTVTGAAVLVVHHTGKPRGKRATSERGSYALRGAADVMIRASQLSGVIHINVDKQKDDELGQEICVRLKQVVVGTNANTKGKITSCVPISADGASGHKRPTLAAGPLATLKALVGTSGHSAESGSWRKAVAPPDGRPIPQKTFQNHRQKLLDDKFVEPVEGRDYWYRATDSGIAMANGVPFERYWHSPNDDAASATPPLGVAGSTGEARGVDILPDLSRPGLRVVR